MSGESAAARPGATRGVLRFGRERVFARDAGGVLPWIVAAMVMLAALALAAALAVDAAARTWRQALTGTMTVELPPLEAGGRALGDARADADRLARTLAVLRQTQGVIRAEPIARARVVALVEPWLGAKVEAAGLPLPQLIDVTLAPGAAIDHATLAARLSAAAPGAMLDDHRGWSNDLVRLAQLAVLLALGVLALVAAVAALSVVLATRARLALHREAIELLHLMGATDHYIAGEFAREALIVAVIGGLAGLTLAAVVATAIVAGAPRFEIGAPAALAGGISAGGWLTLAALPLAAGALALATAWTTARRALRRMV